MDRPDLRWHASAETNRLVRAGEHHPHDTVPGERIRTVIEQNRGVHVVATLRDPRRRPSVADVGQHVAVASHREVSPARGEHVPWFTSEPLTLVDLPSSAG